MKSKKIYILRHGQTEYNRKGMVQGCGIDAPLNEAGQQQAEAFYQAYKHIPFDKIYITPLIRTKQTVSSFIRDGIPFEVMDGLKEISWGTQEGVPFTPETSTAYQEIVKKWTEGDLEARIEGGETPVEVMKRQQPVMEYILGKEDENAILICTHGRAMRILIAWLLKYPLTTMDNFGHANCGVYVLNYTGRLFSVELFNDTEHLVELDF